MAETQRLTNQCWENLDPWEMCGNDKYCTRGCHEDGGCTKGCKVVELYRRLAMYEDRDEKMKEHDKKVKAETIDDYNKALKECLLSIGDIDCEDIDYVASKLKEKNK